MKPTDSHELTDFDNLPKAKPVETTPPKKADAQLTKPETQKQESLNESVVKPKNIKFEMMPMSNALDDLNENAPS
jgi:hypothetical protein